MTLRLRVSDHAVLRYLERVGGFQIEDLRAALTERLTVAACAGANRIKIDGIAYIIRQTEFGPVLVTVMPARDAAAYRFEDGDA